MSYLSQLPTYTALRSYDGASSSNDSSVGSDFDSGDWITEEVIAYCIFPLCHMTC